MAVKKSRGHIFKRGNIYYVSYMVNGKRATKSLNCTSLREAEKNRDEILDPILKVNSIKDVAEVTAKARQKHQPKIFLISSLWNKFERHLKRKGSSIDATNRYKFRIDQFTKWLELNHIPAKNLSDITDETAQLYADYLGSTNIANKTYNETLNSLALVFEIFRDEADILRNPFRKEKLPRKTKLSVSRKEFTEDQARVILNSFKSLQIANKEELEILFYIGIFSGLRLKDACLLTWENIDLPGNNIYVTPEKTKAHGTTVKIPLHPALREKFIQAQTCQVNQYVLPEMAERYNKNRDNVRKLVSRVMSLNGYATTINKENMAESRNKSACQYGFHSLRYTFVSVCAKAGIPQSLVQEIVGHKNPAMTRHYTKFDDKFRQKAINSLNFQQAIPEQAALLESIIERLRTASEDKLLRINEILMKRP